MREGFYSITYTGWTGDSGIGIIALDTEAIVGADAGGARYDGKYSYNSSTEMLEAEITLTVPPGTPLVIGVPPQDKEWSFQINASFPRETSETPIQVDTEFGSVNVVIRFLRTFPD